MIQNDDDHQPDVAPSGAPERPLLEVGVLVVIAILLLVDLIADAAGASSLHVAVEVAATGFAVVAAARLWLRSVAALHEHTSVLGLAFASFHAIVLLGDHHTPFTVLGLLLPFGASFKPLAVGASQLAFYGAALLVGSFYVRKRVGQRTWRIIHFGSFMVFVLALLHGLATGTDRVVMMFGIVPAAVILFFGTYGPWRTCSPNGGHPDPHPRPAS